MVGNPAKDIIVRRIMMICKRDRKSSDAEQVTRASDEEDHDTDVVSVSYSSHLKQQPKKNIKNSFREKKIISFMSRGE